MRDLFFPLLMGLVLLLAACSGPRNDLSSDFTLSLDSTTPTLVAQQGGSKTLQLTITPKNGFTGEVGLSLEGAPEGISLSPTSVRVTGTVPVTVIGQYI
ncbi:hypothetical protein Mcate_02841 [Meiothermus taiwanensis]|uniref:Lipoprotein n=1 Tax=Meiothermus taiwanensis TaxID=172827 RepID=A0A399DW36_9DEIN|nr:hypothetical protein Mcate_02841 [Meiothermus taiwanensis]